MNQRSGESNKAYLFRFNTAARKVNLDYVGNRRNLRLDIKRYARALVDKAFGATLLPLGFQSMMELEEYIDTQRENEAMKKFEHGIKESASPPSPREKGKVAYMESDSSMDVITEALLAEIYALSRSPIKRELCQECGEEHYKVMENVGPTRCAPCANAKVTRIRIVSKRAPCARHRITLLISRLSSARDKLR